MKNIKHFCRRCILPVSFITISAVLITFALTVYADTENQLQDEYLTLNQKYEHLIIENNFAKEYQSKNPENVLITNPKETKPLSVISVQVPTPGIIILACTGACIVKWLRKRELHSI